MLRPEDFLKLPRVLRPEPGTSSHTQLQGTVRLNGRKIEYEEVGSYNWHGRVEEIDGEYVFTQPFP